MPLLRHEVAQEVEYLRLDRHVEGGRRLVGDEDLGLARKRHRDHRALPHAARELVWVVLRARPGMRNADAVEQFYDTVRRLALGEIQVCVDRLTQLASDREHRVEARHRILEDHRDLLASEPLPFGLGLGVEIAPGVASGAGRDATGAGEDSHQCEGGHALATARLTDDSERLSGGERERDAIHRVHGSSACPESHREVLDVEQRSCHARPRSFGSSASRRPSPIRLKPMTTMTMARPGKTARNGAVCR